MAHGPVGYYSFEGGGPGLRANEVIERLFALNEAMESADAFCAYLKELTAHSVLVTEYVLVTPDDVAAPPRRSDPLGSRRDSSGRPLGLSWHVLIPGLRAATAQALDRLLRRSKTKRSLTILGPDRGQRQPFNKRESATKLYKRTTCLPRKVALSRRDPVAEFRRAR